jgi:histidinol-phosphate aminotransferase
MLPPFDIVKPQVRELRAYSLRVNRARVKLNQNENPWDAPLAIKEETQKRIASRPWSRYPEFSPAALHERLAQFSGWRADGILAGNGSNELIQALLMVTIGPGKRVLISEPTFALYRQITTVLGGEVISAPLNEELQYDGARLLEAVRANDPDLIIICSPNNPTGCLLATTDLQSLLESTRGLVAVDEAYFEFSRQSVVPLLEKHANLVVLRTFSKAMALAGLRVGYLLAAPELVREIAKAVLPYNLNALSQIAAEVALEMYESSLRPLVEEIILERDRLFGELSLIDGLNPVRSSANFMVVRSAKDPRKVFEQLLQKEILIRDVSSYPMLRDFFRASVGQPNENEMLIQALREICVG